MVVAIDKLTDEDMRLAKLARGPFGPNVQSAEDLLKAMLGNSDMQQRLGVTREQLITRLKENPVLSEFMVQEANVHRRVQGGQPFAINPDELRGAAEMVPAPAARKKPLAEQIVDAAREVGREHPHITAKELMNGIVERLQDADPDVTQAKILNTIQANRQQMVAQIQQAAKITNLLPEDVASELDARLNRDAMRMRSDAAVAPVFAAAAPAFSAAASATPEGQAPAEPSLRQSAQTQEYMAQLGAQIRAQREREDAARIAAPSFTPPGNELPTQAPSSGRPFRPGSEYGFGVLPEELRPLVLGTQEKQAEKIVAAQVAMDALLREKPMAAAATTQNPYRLDTPPSGLLPDRIVEVGATTPAAGGYYVRPPVPKPPPAPPIESTPVEQVLATKLPELDPNHISIRGGAAAQAAAPQAKPGMDPKVQEMLGKALQAMGMNVNLKDPASFEPALRVACHRAGVEFDKLNIGTEPANDDTKKLMGHMNAQILAHAKGKEQAQALATVASFEGGAPITPDVRSASAKSGGASRG